MSFIIKFIAAFVLLTQSANAFCGFYVAKADGELFNEASKVVYVRDGRKSVITMSSDYTGAPKDFAMIVPTPKVLKRKDVRTVKSATIDHLDAYTAPRLVEYFDHDPCKGGSMSEPVVEAMMEDSSSTRKQKAQRQRGAKALGVTIKAEYAVGIYDILILSAKQSDGLITFLTSEGYKIPNGAEQALAGYIKNRMKFFVAKVNLKRHSKAKTRDLEPLQISFKSRDFMLPIQLGKVNSKGAQDVLVYALSKKGRVETTNYRAQKIPSNMNIPVFVKGMFGDFYKRMYARTARRANVVTEYAWDMAWCDPCAADPLSGAELRELGVSWIKKEANSGQDVFVTRLHMRYERNQMQRDPIFRETRDRENFQGRYVMNHPFVGDISCEAGKDYVKRKRLQLRSEATELADLTGWSIRKIEARIRKSVPKSYW